MKYFKLYEEFLNQKINKSVSDLTVKLRKLKLNIVDLDNEIAISKKEFPEFIGAEFNSPVTNPNYLFELVFSFNKDLNKDDLGDFKDNVLMQIYPKDQLIENDMKNKKMRLFLLKIK